MDVKSYSIHEAKTNLSRLIAAVEAGEEVVLRRRNDPVARIVPYVAPTVRRQPGGLEGQIWMSPDFDDPLPEFDEYTA